MPTVGRKFTPTSKKATLKYVLKISLFSPKDICFYLVYDYVNTSFLGVTLLRALSGIVAAIVPFPFRLWPLKSFRRNTFRLLWYLLGCRQIYVELFRVPSSEKP